MRVRFSNLSYIADKFGFARDGTHIAGSSSGTGQRPARRVGCPSTRHLRLALWQDPLLLVQVFNALQLHGFTAVLPTITKLRHATSRDDVEVGYIFDDKVVDEVRELHAARNRTARLAGTAISRMAAAGGVTQLSGTLCEAFTACQLLSVLPASGLDGVSSAADAGAASGESKCDTPALTTTTSVGHAADVKDSIQTQLLHCGGQSCSSDRKGQR